MHVSVTKLNFPTTPSVTNCLQFPANCLPVWDLDNLHMNIYTNMRVEKVFKYDRNRNLCYIIAWRLWWRLVQMQWDLISFSLVWTLFEMQTMWNLGRSRWEMCAHNCILIRPMIWLGLLSSSSTYFTLFDDYNYTILLLLFIPTFINK